MNKTCSNCKYWGDGMPVQPNTHNKCGKIELDGSFNSIDVVFIDVQVSDDTSLSVKFLTLANFGCLLHTPK